MTEETTMDDAEDAAEKFGNVADNLADRVTTLGEQIDNFLEDNPMRAVLIAFAVGIFLGKIVL